MDFIFGSGATAFWLIIVIILGIVANTKLSKVLTRLDDIELLEQKRNNSSNITKPVSVIEVAPQSHAESIPHPEMASAKVQYNNVVSANVPSPTITDTQQKIVNQGEVDPLSKFGSWLKEDWAMKLGAFFVLLAFIWLAEYAIQENWIGPVGRITLGVFTGTVVMLLGWLDLKKHFSQGSIFFVLGSGISIATIAVSRFIYPEMINPFIATTLMFAFSMFVSFVAVSYNNKALAIISVTTMGLLPLLLNSNGDQPILFMYLIAVMIGAVSVSWLMNFKSVIVLAQIIVALYSFTAIFNTADRATILPMVYVLVASFFASHVFGFMNGKIIDNESDVSIGILNGLILFAWILIAAPKEWQSLTLTIWALIFTIGTYLVSRIIKNTAPYYMYACISGALLAAATTVQFEGPMLAIVFTLEAGAIVYGSFRIHKDLVYSSRLSLLFIVPFILGLSTISSDLWKTGILHTPFFTLLFLSLIPILIGTSFYLEKSMGATIKDEDIDSFRKYTISLLAFGTMYGFTFIWKTLHALIITEYMAVLWSLVIYTIVGLIGYFEGVKNRTNVLVVAGTIVLGLVAARLLLIDVWEMAVAGRFLTFLAIGLLFICSAFYTRKLKRDEPIIHA